MRGHVHGTILAVVVGIALLAPAVGAQGVDASLTARRAGVASTATDQGRDRLPAAPNNFGTQDGIDMWIPASRFTPRTADAEWEDSGDGYYARTMGTGSQWEADLPLINGAFIDGYRVYFYDDDAVNDFSVAFTSRDYDWDIAAPSTVTIDTFDSADGTNAGFQDLYRPVGQTIDQREGTIDRYYAFVVNFNQVNANLMFGGVRVYWYRQVSPAPATATFNDVPTDHIFFRHIEALAASGITAGCGGGNFCPDQAVTRGEMAVFLAKALGLHWVH